MSHHSGTGRLYSKGREHQHDVWLPAVRVHTHRPAACFHRWWEDVKNQPPNIRHINSVQELVNALGEAGDRLVIVGKLPGRSSGDGSASAACTGLLCSEGASPCADSCPTSFPPLLRSFAH